MGKRVTQPAAEDPTAWVQVEDESLATNKANTAIPLTAGETKTTVRWFTPIFGQRIVQVKQAAQGGK